MPFRALFVALVLGALLAVPAAQSQQRATARAATAAPYVKVFAAGPQSPVAGGMQLKAPPPGGSKYVCTNGACSCSGSFDCVKMIAADKACDDTTVGCNDAGCVCTAK